MIDISQNYFCVHTPSATMAVYGWDQRNPFPARGSEAAKTRYREARKAFVEDTRQAQRVSIALLKEAGLPSERRFNQEGNAKKYAEEILRDYGVLLKVSEQCDILI